MTAPLEPRPRFHVKHKWSKWEYCRPVYDSDRKDPESGPYAKQYRVCLKCKRAKTRYISL